MKEVSLPAPVVDVERESFRATLATILALTMVPELTEVQDPATGWRVSRWLGGLGLGLVPVGEPASFAWPGRLLPRFARALARHGILHRLNRLSALWLADLHNPQPKRGPLQSVALVTTRRKPTHALAVDGVFLALSPAPSIGERAHRC